MQPTIAAATGVVVWQRGCGEFEEAFVVPALKDRAEGVHLLQVEVVYVRLTCGVATFFADVRLVSAFLVGEVQLESVYLATVGLKRAALSKGLVTMVTFVRSNACKREQRSNSYHCVH